MREAKKHIARLEDEISRLRIYRQITWGIAVGLSVLLTAFVFYSVSHKEARAFSRTLPEIKSPTDVLVERVNALEARSRELEIQLNELIVMALEERDRVKDVFIHHREVIKSFHPNAFRVLAQEGAIYDFPPVVNQRGERAIDFFRQQLPPRTPSTFRPGAVKRVPEPSPKPYYRERR